MASEHPRLALRRAAAAYLLAAGTALTVPLSGVPASAAAAVRPWRLSAPIASRRVSAPLAGPVSCPSVRVCLGIAGGSLAVTGPVGGGTALRALPWNTTISDTVAPAGVDVSCVSEHLCASLVYTTDRSLDGPTVLFSTTPEAGPATWFAAPVGWPVSCPSERLCLGTESDGSGGGGLAVSSDPAGGAAKWHDVALPGAATGTDAEVTCPSIDFCLAFSRATGAVWTTAAPPQGPWVKASAAASLPALPDHTGYGMAPDPSVVACATSTACVAVAKDGSLLASTAPGSGPWEAVAALPAPTVAVACVPAGTRCLAADSHGDIAVGDVSRGPLSAASSWTAGPLLAAAPSYLACTAAGVCAVGATGPPTVPTVVTAAPAVARSAWSSFTVTTTGRGPLVSGACGAADACVAADGSALAAFSLVGARAGRLTFLPPVRSPLLGESWSGLACPSRTVCVGAAVAADSAMSRAFTFDPLRGPHGFRQVRLAGVMPDDQFLLSAATCIGARCWVGGRRLSGRPAFWSAPVDGLRRSWRTSSVPERGVSCADPHRCLGFSREVSLSLGAAAGTGTLDVGRSARGPWRGREIDPGEELTGAACVPRHGCGAVDAAGNFLTAPAPDGRWVVTGSDPAGFVGLDCAPAGPCVARDGAGALVIARP